MIRQAAREFVSERIRRGYRDAVNLDGPARDERKARSDLHPRTGQVAVQAGTPKAGLRGAPPLTSEGRAAVTAAPQTGTPQEVPMNDDATNVVRLPVREQEPDEQYRPTLDGLFRVLTDPVAPEPIRQGTRVRSTLPGCDWTGTVVGCVGDVFPYRVLWSDGTEEWCSAHELQLLADAEWDAALGQGRG